MDSTTTKLITLCVEALPILLERFQLWEIFLRYHSVIQNLPRGTLWLPKTTGRKLLNNLIYGALSFDAEELVTEWSDVTYC